MKLGSHFIDGFEFCDFCVEYHQKRHAKVKLNYIKKHSVYKCFVCQADMCELCLEHSMKEMESTECYAVGRFPCKKCLEHREQLIEISRNKIIVKLSEAQKEVQCEVVYPVTKRAWKKL